MAEPELTRRPEPDAGPVVVEVTYTVPPEREADFLADQHLDLGQIVFVDAAGGEPPMLRPERLTSA